MKSISTLLIISITWLVDYGWYSNEIDFWELAADNSGNYSIEGEFDSLLTEGSISIRWRQNLNGSVSNNSSFELNFNDE